MCTEGTSQSISQAGIPTETVSVPYLTSTHGSERIGGSLLPPVLTGLDFQVPSSVLLHVLRCFREVFSSSAASEGAQPLVWSCSLLHGQVTGGAEHQLKLLLNASWRLQRRAILPSRGTPGYCRDTVLLDTYKCTKHFKDGQGQWSRVTLSGGEEKGMLKHDCGCSPPVPLTSPCSHLGSQPSPSPGPQGHFPCCCESGTPHSPCRRCWAGNRRCEEEEEGGGWGDSITNLVVGVLLGSVVVGELLRERLHPGGMLRLLVVVVVLVLVQLVLLPLVALPTRFSGRYPDL